MYNNLPSSSGQSSRAREHTSRVRPHTNSRSASITTSDPALIPSHTRSFHTIFESFSGELEPSSHPPSSVTQTTRDPSIIRSHTRSFHTSLRPSPEDSEHPRNSHHPNHINITTSNPAIIPSHTPRIGTNFGKPPPESEPPPRHPHPSPTNRVPPHPPVTHDVAGTSGVLTTSATSTETHGEIHGHPHGTSPTTTREHETSEFTNTTPTIRASPSKPKENHSTEAEKKVLPTPEEGKFQSPRVGLEPTEANHSLQVPPSGAVTQKGVFGSVSDTGNVQITSVPPVQTSSSSTPGFHTTSPDPRATLSTASSSTTLYPTTSYPTVNLPITHTTSPTREPQAIQTSSSNHRAVIAGVSSSVSLVVIILLLLSFCIIRRRRRGRRNHANMGESGEDRVSFRGNNQRARGRSNPTVPEIQTGGERYSSMYTTAEPSNLDAWSRRSQTSLPESINQPPMTVNHLEHYAPTLNSTVSTLPEYAPAQRSISPPVYLESSADQSDDIDHWEDRKSSFETVAGDRC